MNYEALNQWTSTFYSLIHALDIAHKIDFGNQDRLNQSVENEAKIQKGTSEEFH